MYVMEEDSKHSVKMPRFLSAVYGWMAAALIMTAGVAYYVAATPVIMTTIFTSLPAQLLLFLFQIGLVVALSFYLPRMSFPVAVLCFIVYALLLGVTLSVIFYVYMLTSIYTTFATTAAMFGIMSLYGYLTNNDLSAIGSISMMLLLGLIVSLFVNMFLQSPALQYLISGVGVVIFTMLTAYDTQKIKQIGQRLQAEQKTVSKVSLFGALVLYLDFINLFLFLLRFTGQRR